MNGNTVEISTKRAAITSDANTGAASATGDDGLATSKNVADAINKAADAAKAGAAWNLTTNSSTTDKTTVQGGDTVNLINGDNILITQDGTDKKKITVATKKDLYSRFHYSWQYSNEHIWFNKWYDCYYRYWHYNR